MPTPRKALISLQDTPYIHVVSRCVRQAYLCGFDQSTGTDYEYRRAEIEDRLFLVASAFAIDICAYAIMSNHHHEVLFVDVDRAKSWPDEEVIRRWHLIYEGNIRSQRFEKGEPLDEGQLLCLKRDIHVWRERLYSVSWFMRALNEPTARRANKEDKHTGKFFEARFKSQSLLDEQALLSCMAYVDLNPIRAGMAETPESSEYTSIKKRIEATKTGSIPKQMLQFQGKTQKDKTTGIPFASKDYIELVEWSGRLIHPSKRGFIAQDKPPLLKRLKISKEEWLELTQHFEDNFSIWVGNSQSLAQLTTNHKKHHTAGSRRCRQAFAA